MKNSLCLAVLFIVLFIAGNAGTQTKNDLAKNDLDAVRRQISDVQKQLDKAAADRAAAIKVIDLLDKKAAAERQAVIILDRQIKENNAQIKRLKSDEDTLRLKQAEYAGNARVGAIFMVENSYSVGARAVFSGVPAREAAKAVELVNGLNSNLGKRIKEYADTVKELELVRSEAEARNKALGADMAERREIYANYEKNKKEMDQQLSKILKDEKAQKEYLAALKAKQDRIDKAIRDNKKIFTDSPFGRMKGRLPFPMKGTVLENFGIHTHAVSGVRIMNKGIKIAPTGAGDVSAVADGTVVFVDFIPGLQNIIIIQHDKNYYTVYGNLDEFFVTPMTVLTKGTPLGRVNTELPPGDAYLYFEVRNHEEALNPLLWIK